jgi:hypothetical protein
MAGDSLSLAAKVQVNGAVAEGQISLPQLLAAGCCP